MQVPVAMGYYVLKGEIVRYAQSDKGCFSHAILHSIIRYRENKTYKYSLLLNRYTP